MGETFQETAQVVSSKLGLGEILPCPAKLRKTKWMQMDAMLPTVMFLVSNLTFCAQDGNCNIAISGAEAIEQLNQMPLAYLLLTEPRWSGGRHDGDAQKDTA